MKQLLKLILEWVQNHQLQKKRISETQISHFPYNYQDPYATQALTLTLALSPTSTAILFLLIQTLVSLPLIASTTTVHDRSVAGDGAATFSSMVGYMGDPFANGPSNINSHPYQSTSEYHILDSTNTGSPLNSLCLLLTPHFQRRLTRLGSSATKEARKKRMARQRRVFSHHHRHHNHHNQQQQIQALTCKQGPAGNEGCNSGSSSQPSQLGFLALCWCCFKLAGGAPDSPQPQPPPPPPPAVDRQAGQAQNNPRQLAAERRQGWKPEKNLKFLLQKVLKQSDVERGRDAPPRTGSERWDYPSPWRTLELLASGTCGIEFWPNNKSRMYLLENTGDFVRSNGLQEGDFIVIYSGRQMIRGVKVRQSGPKSESKRSGKSQRNQQTASPAGNGSTPSLSKRTTNQHLHTTTVESSRSLALGHCEWNAFALVGSASRQHSV
ncbi:B3 domain-containing transcription factor ABI3 [Vitis vinifera]|uniref:B3 domain-containing transcription factor ABI3 n=1 Tax=Vitis vinifera TaxID=29760 RepID=A0A438H8Y7_VITVI|nr:B3 domain-containing transcription factor ABI3 [Vitis vinifera]